MLSSQVTILRMKGRLTQERQVGTKDKLVILFLKAISKDQSLVLITKLLATSCYVILKNLYRVYQITIVTQYSTIQPWKCTWHYVNCTLKVRYVCVVY